MNDSATKYLSDIYRRLNNLIRYGTIKEVKGNKAKVTIGENTTHWLKWLTQRAGDCVTWWAPSIGEQVTVLSPSGEFNNGVILPAVYTDQPEHEPHKHITQYADGTRIEYDYQAKKLLVDCQGDISIYSSTTITLETQLLKVVGKVHFADGVVVDDDILVDGVSSKFHKHNGDSSGLTSKPIVNN